MSLVPETKVVKESSSASSDADINGSIVNLDHGDPTMYESYWKKLGELENQIKILHKTVGNAVVENHHIVVGTGSSQLLQAALHALSQPLNHPDPIPVLAAKPYYSTYKELTDIVRSRLYEWGGDAQGWNKDGPYIEMVTSPNNPDGATREGVVNGAQGMLIHDLAYYWPQHTAISSPADHDIMIFTLSKCSGHAGSRIGWALVRDEEVARMMVKFMRVSTIGVSKDAQVRAAGILESISGGCTRVGAANFFESSRSLMAERWANLRQALGDNEVLEVELLPLRYCSFRKDLSEEYPAFAWIKCKEGVDLEKVLKEHKIVGRSGVHFGCGAEYVRMSMVSRDNDFNLLLLRLPRIIQSLAN